MESDLSVICLLSYNSSPYFSVQLNLSSRKMYWSQSHGLTHIFKTDYEATLLELYW